MAIGKYGNVLFLSIFDLQTSYWGLKVSEFDQEFISEL